MTRTQKKQALTMFVAGLTPEAIARALELTLAEVGAALKLSPAIEPKPAPVQAEPKRALDPTQVPDGVRLHGAGCATIAPSRIAFTSPAWRRVIRY